MYRKVVLPLDGSKLAETALPHLEEVARGCSISEIFLISVTEAIKGRIYGPGALKQAQLEGHEIKQEQNINVQPGTLFPAYKFREITYPVTFGKMSKTAMNYLMKISEQLEEKGLKTEAKVLFGSPAEEIVKFVEAQQADLIVMASRGHSGFNRWEMGNIAEKVIRAAKVPVLLVKPQADFKETKPRRKGVAS